MKHASSTATMAAAVALIAVLPATAATPTVVRHPLPGNSTFPIAGAVEVPAGKTLVYVSGSVAQVADATAPRDSVAAYGDTRTQALSALASIKAQLEALHLGMADVVKMQVFLAGDPGKGGKMDFAGFTEAYRQYFGTADQPNLPARSTMQVAALVNPGYLVEIEVTAARP